jgi:hypothetical protein
MTTVFKEMTLATRLEILSPLLLSGTSSLPSIGRCVSRQIIDGLSQALTCTLSSGSLDTTHGMEQRLEVVVMVQLQLLLTYIRAASSW